MTEIQFKDTIYQLLYDNPNYRDDTTALINRFWADESGGEFQLKRMSAFDLLFKVSEGTLHSAEAIIKISNDLQQRFKYLRGGQFDIKRQDSSHASKNEASGNESVDQD